MLALTIREALERTLTERPCPIAAARLVDATTRIALIYIKQKVRAGRLYPSSYGLSLEDLALDCCAELFARDERGQYIVLRSFFESVEWQASEESALQIALRRITFSKVNEELFRRNREHDPNLAKIIRNIKDGVKHISALQVRTCGRETWLVVGPDAHLHLDRPAISPEFLEAYIVSALGPTLHVREALTAFVAFVELQATYQNGMPLVAFARCVRAACIRLSMPAPKSVENEVVFLADEMSQAIEWAMEAVQRKLSVAYLQNRKINAATATLYLNAVRCILEAQYLYHTLNECSYFDIVAGQNLGMTEQEYRERHRNRIEYVVKLARAQMGSYLTYVAAESVG